MRKSQVLSYHHKLTHYLQCKYEKITRRIFRLLKKVAWERGVLREIN